MNNTQIIIDIMPYIIPSLLGLVVYIYHQIFQRIPEKQRETLMQLIVPIVSRVEQVYGSLSLDQKKAIIIKMINSAFAAFDIPAPDSAIISALIDAILLAKAV
jgi:hypothetical protein